MIRIPRRLQSIHGGERLPALLLGSAYFFLLMTHYLLKPARDSLFLVGATAEQLPWVYILTALLTAPVVGLYVRASRSYSIRQTLIGTWIILGLQLIAMRFVLQQEQAWVYFLFYAWVGIFGALTTSQFWLLSSTIFDSSQAKRLFPILGTFGILGAVAGGEFTRVLIASGSISTPNLLWVALVFLVLTVTLFANVGEPQALEPSPRSVPSEEQRASGDRLGTLRLLRRSPHLAIAVGIIATSVVAMTLVDYQFKTLAAASHTDPAELTQFFATFYGRVSAISLAIQICSPWIIRRLGAAGILVLLPTLMFGGTLGLILLPSLFAAAFTQGSALSLEYSLDKTGRELLFLPVPSDVKRRVKLFADIVVDRAARGVAGLLILCVAGIGGLGIRGIAGIVVALLLVWIGLVLKMRPRYVDAFRRALARRELDFDGDHGELDPTTLRALIGELDSEDSPRISYALDTLIGFPHAGLSELGLEEKLRSLTSSPHSETRSAALSTLARFAPDNHGLELAPFLAASAPEERQGAAHLLFSSTAEQDRMTLFSSRVLSSDPEIAQTTLDVLSDHGTQLGISLSAETALSILTRFPEEQAFVRAALARAVGRSTSPDLDFILEQLIADRGVSVLTETAKACGFRRRPGHVPWLISLLSRQKLRPIARNSLARYGEPVIDTLREAIQGDTLPIEARLELPKVLSQIDAKDALNLLVQETVSAEPRLADASLVAAARFRRRFPFHRASLTQATAALQRFAREFLAASQAAQTLQNILPESGPLALFRDAIEETKDRSFHQALTTLELIHSATDLEGTRRGLQSASRIDRANAREFLSELLDKRHLPTIQAVTAEQQTEQRDGAKTLFGLEMTTFEDVIDHYTRAPRAWLRACALLAAAEVPTPGRSQIFKDAERDESFIVRETARLALGRRAI